MSNNLAALNENTDVANVIGEIANNPRLVS